MKTKEQQLKKAKADRDKAWADLDKADTDYWKAIEKARADYRKAYDRIQELEKDLEEKEK